MDTTTSNQEDDMEDAYSMNTDMDSLEEDIVEEAEAEAEAEEESEEEIKEDTSSFPLNNNHHHHHHHPESLPILVNSSSPSSNHQPHPHTSLSISKKVSSPVLYLTTTDEENEEIQFNEDEIEEEKEEQGDNALHVHYSNQQQPILTYSSTTASARNHYHPHQNHRHLDVPGFIDKKMQLKKRTYSELKQTEEEGDEEKDMKKWADLLPSLLRRYQNEPPVWQKFSKRTYSDIPTIMLHQEILDFIHFIEPTQEEHLQRSCIIANIEDMLKKAFPNSHLVSFGSYDTLFYLPHSDIDVSLCLDEETPSAHRLNSILTVISRVLMKSKEYTRIEVVRHAKVPIVKAVHHHLGISIDISVNQTVGIATADTVKQFVLKHPALRPLIFVLKMFFHCRELNEVFTGGVSSYTLITMVAGFLETHPLVASDAVQQEQNLGVLLVEWFEVFSQCFHPSYTVFSVHGFKNKTPEFVRQGQLNPHFLSVLDPLNKTNDLARGAKCTKEIQRAIAFAYDTLTHAIVLAQHPSTAYTVSTYLGLILDIHPSLVRKRAALAHYAEEMENQLKKWIHSGSSSSSSSSRKKRG